MGCSNKYYWIANFVRVGFFVFTEPRVKPLSNLKSLRVLMLGKNYIQEVCGLRDMAKLDVLDIHANRLRSVEGIAHLDSLRVLNLAGNFITRVVFGLKTFFFSYFQLLKIFV